MAIIKLFKRQTEYNARPGWLGFVILFSNVETTVVYIYELFAASAARFWVS